MDTPLALSIILFAVMWLLIHFHRHHFAKVEAKLLFVEKQLGELYGPLKMIADTERMAFFHLCKLYGKTLPELVASKDGAKVYVSWLKNVFLPLHESSKELVINHGYLIREQAFEPSNLDMIPTVVMDLEWYFSPENLTKPGVSKLQQYIDLIYEPEKYIDRSVKELKQEQIKLIRKVRNMRLLPPPPWFERIEGANLQMRKNP